MKVDDIIDGIMSLGRGTLLAKFDVESAYRIIPVHPNDLDLLVMQWQGNYFVDITLPFGLPSVPYVFSSVADLVEWVLKKQYDVSFLLHYLDDFHTLGPPNSQTCQRNVDTSIHHIPGLGDSPSPWQGGKPFHYPDCFRHKTRFSPIAGPPPARKIWSYPHTPGLLVTKTPLHTEGAGAFNWQS